VIGFRTVINLYPVAVAVDKRELDGQLMPERRESGFNNWPLVGTGGNEMLSRAAGLTIICGQWLGAITKVLGVSPWTPIRFGDSSCYAANK
jgi:hypothetical protein